MKAVLLLSIALLTACTSAPAEQWFVIAATKANVDDAISAVKALRPVWPDALVVATDDCTNLKPGLFLAVVQAVEMRSPAEQALSTLKKSVSDAYVRQCQAKAGTLVSLGLPLIDKSIYEVSPAAVNWDAQDKVSEIHSTRYGNIWIRRRFDKVAEDPREGRRESVYVLASKTSSPRELASDCVRPQFAIAANLLALACVSEVVGQGLLHKTMLIEIQSGKVLKTIERCRKPDFPGPLEFSCEAESVTASGEVNLTPKRVRTK